MSNDSELRHLAREYAIAARPEPVAVDAWPLPLEQTTYGFFERSNSRLCAATLRAIWDRQGGLCALTGRVLQQNRDTELDHIVPRARGGSNEASNRQWVCRAANRLKSNLSDPEFIRFCIEVADHERARFDTGAQI